MEVSDSISSSIMKVCGSAEYDVLVVASKENISVGFETTVIALQKDTINVTFYC